MKIINKNMSYLVLIISALSFSPSQAQESPAPEPVLQEEEAVPSGGKRFEFDPKQNKWFAYDDDGTLVRSGIASGGKNNFRTPAGVYSTIEKRGKGCKSSKYPVPRGGAPMPYCMFFHGGFAIHGSNDVPTDRHASHGCVRVEVPEAEWLSKEFMEIGTPVIIHTYADSKS